MTKIKLRTRLTKAQKLIKGNKMDAVIVGPSSDFAYFFGDTPRPTQRFLGLIIPVEGKATAIVPQLEAETYRKYSEEMDVFSWGDHENPFEILTEVLKKYDASIIGTNDDFWSTFLYQLQEEFPTVKYISGAPVLSRLRLIKEDVEIEALREASQKIDDVWAKFCETVSPIIGKTENDLRKIITELMSEVGFSETAWCDVGAGPNGAIPLHHGSDQVIKRGDPIVIDFAGKYKGYCADICRTIVAGEPAAEFVTIYNIVKKAQKAASEAIKVGVPCEQIDQVARDIISDYGFGDHFIHRIGHGIGLDYHENPYMVTGNEETLEVGMTFSNEPGIYIPGKWGVRIEDIIVVTKDGAEIFNDSPRELMCFD